MGSLIQRDTTSGRIEGVSHAGVSSFLGVPYGASTAGEGRFAAPRPPQPWDGVRSAMAFGDAAPQHDTRLLAGGPWIAVQQLMYPKGGHPLDGARMSEDSLVLNVWSPETEGPHPVMVWLHGGGFVHGSGGSYLYHGDRLAEVGDVVVVTLNHRLGLLGYLPLNTVDPDYPDASSAGMLDVVLALEWVRDNIATFGGDPSNVTAFGQSGGGVKASMLTGMPAAKGLFHKIINMSGAGFDLDTPGQARVLAERVQRLAGVEDLRELASWDSRALTALQSQVATLGVSSDGDDEAEPLSPMGFAPMVDGVHVTHQPLAARVSTDVAPVPLLIGYASHDASLLLCNSEEFADLRAADVERQVLEAYGEAGSRALANYRESYPDEPPRLHLARVTTDASFRAGALAWAERHQANGHPVFAYEFAYQTPILDGLLGAPHSLDLAFAFDTTDRTWFAGGNPDREQVAAAMAQAWARFAWTGDPNHDGLPEWAPFSNGRTTMRLDAQPGLFASPQVADLPSLTWSVASSSGSSVAP